MLTLDSLTKIQINNYVGQNNVKRATGYLGRLSNLVRKGETLQANVQGNQLYQVEITIQAGEIVSSCTCAMQSRCKHVAAVLLRWNGGPQVFEVEEARPIHLLPGFPFEVTVVEPPPTKHPDKVPEWIDTDLAKRQHKARKDLEEFLSRAVMQELRQLAEERAWKIKGSRKNDVVAQLVEQMLDPTQIQAAYAALDDESRQVLRAVALMGSFDHFAPADYERVAEHWGKLKKYKKINTYGDRLWESGLAIPTKRVEPQGYYDKIYLPQAALGRYPALLADALPHSPELPSQVTPGELRLADAGALLESLHQFFSLVAHQTVALRPPMPRPKLEKNYTSLRHWDYDPAWLHQFEQAGKLREKNSLVLKVPPPASPLPDTILSTWATTPDEGERLTFLYHLALKSGLLQPGSPITIWPEVHTHFLKLEEAVQRAMLFRHYTSLQTWSELWMVLRKEPSLQLWRTTYPNAHSSPENVLLPSLQSARQMVLTALAWLPDQEWIDLSSFLKMMQAVWPHFYANYWTRAAYFYPGENRTAGAWHLANGTRSLAGDQQWQDWMLAQGNFITAILQGPLSWLGMVDLHHVNGAITHFRLRGLRYIFLDQSDRLGDQVAGQTTGQVVGGQGIGQTNRQEATQPSATASAKIPATKQPTPPALSADALRVDGARILIDPTQIKGRAHSLLEKIAKLELTSPKQFVYRLDVTTAHRSFEKGLALHDFLEEWRSLLGASLPDAVQKPLQKWWDAYGQVRLYHDVTIIELGDDYALTEMKATTSITKLMIAELSPRLVIIPKHAINTLVAELEKAGYTPKREE